MHPSHLANVNRHDEAPRGHVSEADLDQLAAERLNRIPRQRTRLQVARPPLATRIRRLHLRLRIRVEVLVVRWRINRLAAEGREIACTVAYDAVAAAVHELKLENDPVLQHRMTANRKRLRQVGEQILQLQVKQAGLELFL